MRLVCISDSHTKHKDLGTLPDGDVLIHAGDWTYRGGRGEIQTFLEWFDSQPHKHKIFIAGNHEFTLDRMHQNYDSLLRTMTMERVQYHSGSSVHYLENTGIEIEGVKFWGSPYTPPFKGWGFPIPDEEPDFWEQIPKDTDVLITHGPAHGILDQVGLGQHLGCYRLRETTEWLDLQAHVHGHIHDSYGTSLRADNMRVVNAASCNEAYRCVNAPIVIDVIPQRVIR